MSNDQGGGEPPNPGIPPQSGQPAQPPYTPPPQQPYAAPPGGYPPQHGAPPHPYGGHPQGYYPPPKSNRGLIIGLVSVVAVLVVALAAVAIIWMTGGFGGSGRTASSGSSGSAFSSSSGDTGSGSSEVSGTWLLGEAGGYWKPSCSDRLAIQFGSAGSFQANENGGEGRWENGSYTLSGNSITIVTGHTETGTVERLGPNQMRLTIDGRPMTLVRCTQAGPGGSQIN